MMPTHATAAVVLAGLAAAACIAGDNPTALADLDLDVAFEMDAARVETLEEIEVRIKLMQDGAMMTLRKGQLTIEHAGSGTVRTVDMEPTAGGYKAHVMFFEEGEHHIQVMGMPERHRLMASLHEHEVHAHNQHRIIGPYWVELVAAPAPVYEDSSAHLHLMVYDTLTDGSRGDPIGGLTLSAEVHAPNGEETVLSVMEEDPGEYEAAFTFGHAGLYELHVAIMLNNGAAEGEFHVPVLSPADTTGSTGKGGKGHGH